MAVVAAPRSTSSAASSGEGASGSRSENKDPPRCATGPSASLAAGTRGGGGGMATVSMAAVTSASGFPRTEGGVSRMVFTASTALVTASSPSADSSAVASVETSDSRRGLPPRVLDDPRWRDSAHRACARARIWARTWGRRSRRERSRLASRAPRPAIATAPSSRISRPACGPRWTRGRCRTCWRARRARPPREGSPCLTPARALRDVRGACAAASARPRLAGGIDAKTKRLTVKKNAESFFQFSIRCKNGFHSFIRRIASPRAPARGVCSTFPALLGRSAAPPLGSFSLTKFKKRFF